MLSVFAVRQEHNSLASALEKRKRTMLLPGSVHTVICPHCTEKWGKGQGCDTF